MSISSSQTTTLSHAQQLSYQIVLNAYLREVKSSWQTVSADSIKDSSILDHFSGQEQACWVHISLPSQGVEIIASVSYWSLTERHQFNFPILMRPINIENGAWQELELASFVSLTMREEGQNNHRGQGQLNLLMQRVLASAHNTDIFCHHRNQDLTKLNDGRALSFIDSEQSLIIGHQLHPVAKSREGFSSSDLINYSPETAGKFQLCYFSADLNLLHEDSALESSASEIVRVQLEKELKGQVLPSALLKALKSKRGLIPVHPWQANYLLNQADVKTLLNTGQLDYLGPLGKEYRATTSIRTVFHEDNDFMLKFSLNVRITNSERVNKSWELDRVVETARLLNLPISDEISASAPDFEIVSEPAYLSIKVNDRVLDGFSVILRDNKSFKDPSRDISAITSLVQDNPEGGNSRLFNIISQIAKRESRPATAVAIDWFEKYLEVSIESLMRLFIDWGLCFEPHGQNTLIEMRKGYPVRCFCRDGQGFFHRQAAHQDWQEIMPGKGEATESIFPEDLARERLIYYPFINQVFSVINALGCARLAEEENLMKQLRDKLHSIAAQPQRYPFTLLDVLETATNLPCKGNLLTQLYNMDELVGDIATQSVYINLDNCYRAAASKSKSNVKRILCETIEL